MKLKYFLRGVGVGIIFGALIMLVAYLTSGAGTLSDEEIIERAENLGMVKEESLVIGSTKDEDNTAEITAEDGDKNNTEEVSSTTGTQENSTEDLIQDSDVSIEGVVDDSINTTTEASTTEDATTTENVTEEDSTYVTAKISVSSGMTSSEVAMLLQNAEIIDDYEEFDAFLIEKGYSTQIRINDYEFNSNMTYEELAQELIKEDKK